MWDSFSVELIPHYHTFGSRVPRLGRIPRPSSVTNMQRTKHAPPANHQPDICSWIRTCLPMLLQTLAYCMPVYFQAVRYASPFKAGIDFLPYTAAVVPFGIFAGIFMSKTGLYRPIHWAGVALNAIGSGLLSTLDAGSSKAAWACFQIIVAGDTGMDMAAILPSISAALPESGVAMATGAYSFMRSFEYVWGVTLPSITFNGQFNRYVDRISDRIVRAELLNGAAYGHASGDFLRTLPVDSQSEVTGVYVDALQTVWQVAVALSCLGFLGVCIEKHVELRKILNTEYRLEQAKEDATPSTQPGSEDALRAEPKHHSVGRRGRQAEPDSPELQTNGVKCSGN